jgi:hypothetical protein
MTYAAGECPLPPPDIQDRLLPVIEIDLAVRALWRIHRSNFSPIFFNRVTSSTTRYRFDAPGDAFGVIYGGFSFSSCMFETVIRNRYEGLSAPLRMGLHELEQRSVSRLALAVPGTLRLADFTQSLAPLGGSTQVMSVDDYTVPNLWSQAVHDNHQSLDGIYFQSRFSNEPCVAIFHRVPVVVDGAPTPLLMAAEMDAFLDRYQIALL